MIRKIVGINEASKTSNTSKPIEVEVIPKIKLKDLKPGDKIYVYYRYIKGVVAEVTNIIKFTHGFEICYKTDDDDDFIDIMELTPRNNDVSDDYTFFHLRHEYRPRKREPHLYKELVSTDYKKFLEIANKDYHKM